MFELVSTTVPFRPSPGLVADAVERSSLDVLPWLMVLEKNMLFERVTDPVTHVLDRMPRQQLETAVADYESHMLNADQVGTETAQRKMAEVIRGINPWVWKLFSEGTGLFSNRSILMVSQPDRLLEEEIRDVSWSLFLFPGLDAVGHNAIERIAKEEGFYFAHAAYFLKASDTPYRAALRLRRIIRRCKMKGIPFKRFEILTTEEKLALYAVYRKSVEGNRPSFCVMPTFGNFLKFLKMVSAIPGGDEVVSRLADPGGTFDRMASTVYQLRYRRPPWETQRSPETPYDLLCMLYSQQLPGNLLERCHWVLAEAARREMPKIEAAVFEAVRSCYYGGKPGARERRFESAVDRFSACGSLDFRFSDPKGWEAAAAVFILAEKALEGKVKFAGGFPSYLDLCFNFQLEWKWCLSGGKPHSFSEFAAGFFSWSSGVRHPYEFIPPARLRGFLKAIPPEIFFRLRKMMKSGNGGRIFSDYLMNTRSDRSAVWMVNAFHLARKGIVFGDAISFPKGPARRDGDLAKRLRAQAGRFWRGYTDAQSLEKPDPLELGAAYLALDAREAISFRSFVTNALNVSLEPAAAGIRPAPFSIMATLQNLSMGERQGREQLGQEISLFSKEVPSLDKWLRKEKNKKNIPKSLKKEFSRWFVGRQLVELAGDLFGEDEEEEKGKAAEEGKIHQATEELMKKWKLLGRNGNPSLLESFILAVAKSRSPDLVARIGENAQGLSVERCIEVVSALHEFYADRFMDLLGCRPGEKIADRIRRLGKFQRNNLWPIRVRIVPSRTWLDAFCAIKARNCLAQDPYTHGFIRFSLTDPSFVPCRIKVGGRWRGTVMTNTYEINRRGKLKKMLILHGIDPDPDFFVEPAEFVRNLVAGFSAMATRRGYDLVVIPKNRGLQSTRPDLVSEALAGISRRFLFIEGGFRFPKVGSDRYYNPEKPHQNFYILWERGATKSS